MHALLILAFLFVHPTIDAEACSPPALPDFPGKPEPQPPVQPPSQPPVPPPMVPPPSTGPGQPQLTAEQQEHLDLLLKCYRDKKEPRRKVLLEMTRRRKSDDGYELTKDEVAAARLELQMLNADKGDWFPALNLSIGSAGLNHWTGPNVQVEHVSGSNEAIIRVIGEVSHIDVGRMNTGFKQSGRVIKADDVLIYFHVSTAGMVDGTPAKLPKTVFSIAGTKTCQLADGGSRTILEAVQVSDVVLAEYRTIVRMGGVQPKKQQPTRPTAP